jgi:hypothetical protein
MSAEDKNFTYFTDGNGDLIYIKRDETICIRTNKSTRAIYLHMRFSHVIYIVTHSDEGFKEKVKEILTKLYTGFVFDKSENESN